MRGAAGSLGIRSDVQIRARPGFFAHNLVLLYWGSPRALRSVARSMSGARPLAELDTDEAGRRELSALLVRFRCLRLQRLDCDV